MAPASALDLTQPLKDRWHCECALGKVYTRLRQGSNTSRSLAKPSTSVSRLDRAQKGIFSLAVAEGRTSGVVESPRRGAQLCRRDARREGAHSHSTSDINCAAAQREAQGAVANGHGITPQLHEGVRQHGFLWGPLDPANGMTPT